MRLRARVHHLLSRLLSRLVGCRAASGEVVRGGLVVLQQIAPVPRARLPVRRPLVARTQLEGGCERGSELAVLVQLADRLDARARLALARVLATLMLVSSLPGGVPVRRLRVGRRGIELVDVTVGARARDPGRRVAVADLGVVPAATGLLRAELQREGDRFRALPVLCGLADRLDPRPTAARVLASTLCLVGALGGPVTFPAAAFEDAVFDWETEPP